MKLLAASLSDRFLSITGPDAVKFLQGQTSCDLNELSETKFSYGTLNTPKGRMYCLFKVIKRDNGLLLSMNESVLDNTLSKLSKYAVFFKCTLKEEENFRAIGITLESDKDYAEFLSQINNTTKEPFSLSKQENAYCLNLSTNQKLAYIWHDEKLASLLDTDQVIAADHWHALETKSGIPEIYDSSVEEFILQNLSLQKLGAVSFKKGCYTGQEIIARMKFLGKVKKQTYLIQTDTQLTPAPLTPVFDPEGKKCGTLVRAHFSSETGTVALCILSIESALNYAGVFLDESLSTACSVSEIDYSEFDLIK